MNNITLLYGFNNYYNRKLIRYATKAEYIAAADDSVTVSNVINFDPADGISTKWINNFTAAYVSYGDPDYIIICDDSANIQSRWFVVDTVRTRGLQYQLDLYRDTVAEVWTSIQDAPVFVEKGILPQTDPMIFNHEDMTFNQVKTREYPIQDEVGIPWIVGYMAPSASGDKSFSPEINPDYEYSAISDYPYYSYSTGTKMYIDFIYRTYTLVADTDFSMSYQFEFNESVYGVSEILPAGSSLIVADEDLKESFGSAMKRYASGITSGVKTALGVQADVLTAENGKIIKVGSTYYRVSVSARGFETVSQTSTGTSGAAFNAFETAMTAANADFPFLESSSTSPATGNARSYKYKGTKIYLTISIDVIPGVSAINYKISTTKRNLQDQPYCMFAMPYGRTVIDGVTGLDDAIDYTRISMLVAKDISEQFGGSSPDLYDLQLVPYMPIREYYNENTGLLSVTGKTLDADYSLITQDSTNIGIIFWCTKSKATFETVDYPLPVTDYKVDNETKKYRLCSPNFSGQFEFSSAMNGSVERYRIDFTYKPYNPYIHVAPKFGNLYGSDFGDARGLVCGGKFDLPQTADAWASYERSNANYNSIFDRQISNLEVQQKYARVGDIAGAIAGTVQGVGTGAALGMTAGGGVGGVIGGVIGGAASLAGGVADVAINEKLRQETMSYTKDMYGYQLGNIQAMPQSLVSVGALTNNNKLFPFVEVYEATDAEVEALKNKIRFNGMSVGRIGTIAEFSAYTWTYSNGWNYFKGQLIRAELSGYDWHFINTLRSELDRGIFIEEV